MHLDETHEQKKTTIFVISTENWMMTDKEAKDIKNIKVVMQARRQEKNIPLVVFRNKHSMGSEENILNIKMF